MKTKVISFRDFAAIKKMAQIVNPLVSKKATILKKINALKEEIEGPSGLDVQISGMEAGIKAKFFGLGTEQLVKKVVTPCVHDDGTPVLTAQGKQQLKTTWEPMPCVKFNEDTRNYTLTVEDDEDVAAKYDEDVEAKEAEAAFNEIDADNQSTDNTVEVDNPFNM